MFSIRVRQRSKLWEMLKDRGVAYVSSTELASVFHASSYGSRRKLSEKKTKGIRKPFSFNPAQNHGETFEPLAIKKASDWLDEKLGKRHDWMRPGIIRDPWSVVTCSPDQICSDFGLEVKCPWKRKLPERKEDLINDNLLQCFACIHVTKFTHWYLWFYDSYTGNSVAYRVNQNQKLWKEVVAPAAASYLESLDSQEAFRVKRKKDGEAWNELREALLQGVERVL